MRKKEIADHWDDWFYEEVENNTLAGIKDDARTNSLYSEDDQRWNNAINQSFDSQNGSMSLSKSKKVAFGKAGSRIVGGEDISPDRYIF
jgi:hypothetical protein